MIKLIKFDKTLIFALPTSKVQNSKEGRRVPLTLKWVTHRPRIADVENSTFHVRPEKISTHNYWKDDMKLGHNCVFVGNRCKLQWEPVSFVLEHRTEI